MPVRWGIISTASINDKLLAGARQADGAEIVAVASRDGDAARRYARDNAIRRAHAGYDALLADPDVEVVYISLPNALHLEWTARALRAGKHVLCEKPLGRRAAAVEEAFDIAEREGRLLMEAFMFRHNPQTLRLAELVAEGAVGRLRTITAWFRISVPDPANVRLRAALDGGALMDLGCYCVSASRLLAGEPERVSAEQVIGGDGVDVSFAATMRFAGDVLAQFDAGFQHARGDGLEVVGDEATLWLADPWHCRTPLIERRREGAPPELIETELVDSYRLEVENLSAAVRGEAEPLLGRDDAFGQARTIEALYAAADGARAVAV